MRLGKKQRLWALIAALLMLCALILFLALRPASAPASPMPSEALTQAAKGLDEAAIDMALSDDGGTLTLRQTLTLRNREQTTLDTLVLRAYANAFASEETSPAATEELYDLCYPGGFSEGYVTLRSLTAREKPATYAFTDDARTVLTVTPENGWLPGETLTLDMSYEVTIPSISHRFGRSGGITALGNALILPSVYLDGAWRTDEYLSIGDPFIARCMNFSVDLTLPDGYQAAASCYAVPTRTADGGLYYRYRGYAMRDFALSVSKEYRFAYETAGGALVIGAGLNEKAAKELARCGAQALTVYGELFGAYPYPTFTLAQVHFPFGGMEYPGYVMIADTLTGQDMELTAAHETAHQWWYAVVGSDPYYQAWQDEGLAEYSALGYWERYYGAEAREELAQVRLGTAMRVLVPKGVTPGSPIDYFGDLSEYALVVYRRGGALFEALRLMDSEGLSRFLRAYYEQYQFSLATREDFTRLSHTAFTMDIEPLMTDYLDTYISN